ncbi:HAD family hydrolase [Candidatus Roizmanbacteria bacterium]|nr:HAD family hydrolase [Candidatus Roizmanbacteria bacterium]
MVERGAVCFDFHHTLVDYEGHLRPGTIDLFKNLQKSGMAIILTTTGGKQHLQDVMSATGIRSYFANVFEGSETNVGSGKMYGPAAAALGLSSKEAPHKMIAIGDLLDDQPADLPIVFIHHPSGFRYDASLLDHLIQRLLRAGRNSFIEGFDKIKRDQKTPVLDGISVTLSYRDPREGGKNLPLFTPGIRIPTISVVGADKYLRNRF